MEIRTAYKPFKKEGVKNTSPSRTQQQFKDECDVNNIIRKFGDSGSFSDPLNPSTRQPMFGDFEIFDYQSALNTVIAAQAMFDDLPSEIRERFNYDPAKYLDFVENPANREEGERLGIYVKQPDPVLIVEDSKPAE